LYVKIKDTPCAEFNIHWYIILRVLKKQARPLHSRAFACMSFSISFQIEICALSSRLLGFEKKKIGELNTNLVQEEKIKSKANTKASKPPSACFTCIFMASRAVCFTAAIARRTSMDGPATTSAGAGGGGRCKEESRDGGGWSSIGA
jgi:hypothetical protein